MEINDYEFQYTNYLAEMKLYDSLYTFSKLKDDASPESVNEAAKLSINEYVKKVCGSAQTAWNNFKQKVATKEQVKKLKEMAPNIIGPKAKQLTFRIDNYPTYDLNTFNQIKVKPFEYMKMRDNCKSQNQYLRTYASKLVRNDSNRILKNFRAETKKGTTTTVMDNRNIQKIYNFCYKDFYRYRDLIAQDIEAINRSGNSVLGMSESFDLFDDSDLEMLSEKSIFQVSKMGAPKEKPKNMTFTATNGKQITDADLKATSFNRAMTIYLKCNMGIISAKMKVLRKIYQDYFNILEHYNQLCTTTNTPKPNIKV